MITRTVLMVVFTLVGPALCVADGPRRADGDWWSLRPLSQAEPPAPPDIPRAWAARPVDRFVYAALAQKGLKPSPPAPRRSLIRRVSCDLIGLPPTPEEVEAFVADADPEAYEKLVDRLLDSPHHGEHWGRHWLDVIRFGESTGFERNVIVNNAWPFRDYVIRSFNEDRPFDRMVLEHVAGDVIAPGDADVEIGTTFLVCGPYDNVGNQDAAQVAQIRANTIDEMIRATGEAFLGLTVGCARCHDHKFDPIVQRDYYGLYATFAGVQHGSRVIATPERRRDHAAKRQPLVEARDALAGRRGKLQAAILDRALQNASGHEGAWTRPPVDRTGTEETFDPVRVRYVRLVGEGVDTDPNRSIGFNIDEFEVWTARESSRNVALASAGGEARGRSRVAEDFADAYSPAITNDGEYHARWIAAGAELTITLARPETIHRVLFSSDRQGAAGAQSVAAFVCEYRIEVSQDGEDWTTVASSRDRRPLSEAHRRRRLIDLTITPEDRGRLAEIDGELARIGREIAAIGALPSWWAGTFHQASGPFHVLQGGDPQNKGEEVVPASLSAFDGVVPSYRIAAGAPESERRLALARWIVSRDNPLTPRVLANRLWHYHFGTGIVDTPSDFGFMGGRPTHPELLDWLARRVHEHGWRLKPIHRLIVLSQTYRQSTAFRVEAARVDADSRSLWRYPPRRLAAEEIRDTMLHIAGKLDERMGGPGFRLYRYLEDNVATYVPLDRHGPETYRRSVYHQNARAAAVDLLVEFDCPDNAFGAPRRASTTTPLQALTMMNHRFTVDMAGFLAERVRRDVGDGDTPDGDVPGQIRRSFALAYARPPAPEELAAAEAIVRAHGLRAFCRAILNSNELIYLD